METAPVLVTNPILTPLSETIMPNLEVKVSPVCPWGQVKAVEAVSFNEVMSEQLAHLLNEDTKPVPEKPTPVFVDDLVGCGEDVTDCGDDFLLAKMLQLDFDKEHDKILKHEESKYNGQSKVKISYGKYRRLPTPGDLSSEEEEDKEYHLEQSAKNHWKNFEEAEKSFQSMGKSGVNRQGNVTTTKHDLTMCARRNAGKLMKFSTSIPTGDGGQFDMKLSNNVYNTLKTHSISEEKRGKRLHEKKEKSTAEKALDENTHLILYKLVNNQTLDTLSGCFSTGKEACVYHAWSGLPPEKSPAEFAIKVFKTTLNEFQNRDEYVKGDHRFRNRLTKQNPRKVIHMWAEKEMRNLLRMREANISCPDVVVLNKHVLVMTFIGKDMIPAPKIKELDLPFEDMTIMYEQAVDILKALYTKCRLVHADFSEYNLLWYDEKLWAIDVSQAVDLTHPQAHQFLLRDCSNVTTFFKKKGVLQVPSPEDLFFEVCGQFPQKDIKEPDLY